MSPDEFRNEMDLLQAAIKANNALVAQTLAEHGRTQQRIDGVVASLRQGLREDITLVIQPVLDKVDSHGKKIDDHETRIRGLEKSGTKRDVILGGAAGMMGGIAGLGISAVIESVKAVLKIKGGP